VFEGLRGRYSKDRPTTSDFLHNFYKKKLAGLGGKLVSEKWSSKKIGPCRRRLPPLGTLNVVRCVVEDFRKDLPHNEVPNPDSATRLAIAFYARLPTPGGQGAEDEFKELQAHRAQRLGRNGGFWTHAEQ